MMHDDASNAVLDAALAHVPFDGWTEAAFRGAIADSGVEPALARALYPRGGVDLALAWHARGDRHMLERLAMVRLEDLRMRDRVATAVRLRIEAICDRELLRRSMTLFALPPHAADGARAIWGTADQIWTALGDTSRDANWYSKRAILSGVYSATVLYWLGDESPGQMATRDFLDRRIDEVMQFEKVKATANANPVFRAAFALPLWALGQIRAPQPRTDLPGKWEPGPPRDPVPEDARESSGSNR